MVGAGVNEVMLALTGMSRMVHPHIVTFQKGPLGKGARRDVPLRPGNPMNLLPGPIRGWVS